MPRNVSSSTPDPPRLSVETDRDLPDCALTDACVGDDFPFLVRLELLNRVEFALLSLEVARSGRAGRVERGRRALESSLVHPTVRPGRDEAHD